MITQAAHAGLAEKLTAFSATLYRPFLPSSWDWHLMWVVICAISPVLLLRPARTDKVAQDAMAMDRGRDKAGNTMTTRLFVYGTLMRASRHPMARLLTRHARSLGEATFQGRLYRIGHYPAAVDSEDPSDRVFGDVYALIRPAFAFRALDAYEGCGPGFNKPTEYLRVTRQITLASGENVAAWIYLYNRPVAPARRMISGRFT